MKIVVTRTIELNRIYLGLSFISVNALSFLTGMYPNKPFLPYSKDDLPLSLTAWILALLTFFLFRRAKSKI